MLVVLVEQRDVVVDVFLLAEHPPHAVLHDCRDLVRVGRIVGDAVRHRRGEEVRVPVLVLQTFAVERRAAGRAAEQKSARAHVAGRPSEVADALKPEHRVEDEERQRLHAVGRVRRPRRDPRAHRAGFGDPFLKDLAGFVLAIPHQLIGVLRPVELTDVRVDPELAEHPFHSEGARLVGDDRDDARADRLVAQDRRERAHERHRRRDLALAGRFEQRRERAALRHRERLSRRCAGGPGPRRAWRCGRAGTPPRASQARA